MAKIDEIIEARQNAEQYIDPRVYDVRKTATGLTEQERVNNILSTLVDNGIATDWLNDEGIEYVENPTEPTLAKFMSVLDLKDDSEKDEDGQPNPERKTAYEKLIDDYPKKWESWKKKIEADPELGEPAWKTFKKLWRGAVHDRRVAETAKERDKAMTDAPLSYYIPKLGWKNIPDFLPSGWTRTLSEMAFPRTTERVASGNTVQPKDVLLDLGENAAMSVPGTGFVKLGGAAARKAAPRLASAILAAGDALRAKRLGYIPGAGRLMANTAGNTVVPLASEIADNIAYDPGEGMDDRADFSTGDVAVGGLVNQAVGRGLVRGIGPYIDRYGGELRNYGARRIRDFLNSLGKSQKEIGEEWVARARAKAAAPVRISEGLTPDEYTSLAHGVLPDENVAANLDEVVDANVNKRVANLIDDGTLKVVEPNKDWPVKDYEGAYLNNMGLSRSQLGRTKKVIDNGRATADDVDFVKIAEEGSPDLAKKSADDLITEGAIYDEIADNTAGTVKPSALFTGLDLTMDGRPNSIVSRGKAAKVIDENPELYNYAFWKNAPLGAKVQNAVHQAYPSLVINKLGKGEYAPEAVRTFKQDIANDREESRREGARVAVSKVIAANKADLTEEDKKFLNAIREKPDRVTAGYKTEDDPEGSRFKMWLLLRGNDYLRGTGVSRPSWTVE